VLDMLVYERADGALVIGAGVPEDWLGQGGIRVERLRTPSGRLSFHLRGDGSRIQLSYRLEGSPPAAGLVLAFPREHRLPGASGEVELNR